MSLGRASWFWLTAGLSAGCVSRELPKVDAGGAALYREVDGIITDSCARQTCHGALVANAHMDLMAKGFRAALVDVPSCEYDRMKRVAPGDPDHSWIMIKLAGPVRFRQYANFVDIVPAADWKASIPECAGSFDDGSPWFGTRMPPQDTTTISDAEIATIRAWIEAGAPGP
jgi:hypothetical protein